MEEEARISIKLVCNCHKLHFCVNAVLHNHALEVSAFASHYLLLQHARNVILMLQVLSVADKCCLTPDNVYLILVLCLCMYKHAHPLSTTQLYTATCVAAAAHENNVTNLDVVTCCLHITATRLSVVMQTVILDILHGILLMQLAVQSILIH